MSFFLFFPPFLSFTKGGGQAFFSPLEEVNLAQGIQVCAFLLSFFLSFLGKRDTRGGGTTRFSRDFSFGSNEGKTFLFFFLQLWGKKKEAFPPKPWHLWGT